MGQIVARTWDPESDDGNDASATVSIADSWGHIYQFIAGGRIMRASAGAPFLDRDQEGGGVR